MANDEFIKFDKDNKGLIIPVREDDFKTFISSLLGQPQTINQSYYVVYRIGISEIENCFYLIDQRISQQNEANLIQFTTTIVYDDGSSVSVNGLEHLQSYRETSDITSVGVHLNWIYLIKFQDKSVPEKQTIQLTISTSNEYTYFARRHYAYNSISLRIEHTARTWGVEIKNLISNQVTKWDNKGPKVEIFVRRYGRILSLIVALSFFLFSSYYSFRTAEPIVQEFQKYAIEARAGNVNQKLDFIINYISQAKVFHAYTKAWLGTLAALGLSVLIFLFLEAQSHITRKSYVLLSDNSRKMLAEDDLENRWTLKYFIGSAIVSTVAGFLSKYAIFLILGT